MKFNSTFSLLILITSLICINCENEFKYMLGYKKLHNHDQQSASEQCGKLGGYLPEVTKEEDITNMLVAYSLDVGSTKVWLGHTYQKDKGWVSPTLNNTYNSFLNQRIKRENNCTNCCLVFKFDRDKSKIEQLDCNSNSSVDIIICGIRKKGGIDNLKENLSYFYERGLWTNIIFDCGIILIFVICYICSKKTKEMKSYSFIQNVNGLKYKQNEKEEEEKNDETQFQECTFVPFDDIEDVKTY